MSSYSTTERLGSTTLGPSLYPPKSPADVRRLLHSIQSTELDRLKKDCYFYYLLLDYDGQPEARKPNGHVEGMDVDDEDAVLIVKSVEATKVADRFARNRCMPRHWRIFIDGYWALDHGSWKVRYWNDSQAVNANN